MILGRIIPGQPLNFAARWPASRAQAENIGSTYALCHGVYILLVGHKETQPGRIDLSLSAQADLEVFSVRDNAKMRMVAIRISFEI